MREGKIVVRMDYAKRCTVCDETKPSSAFQAGRGACRTCRAALRYERAERPEVAKLVRHLAGMTV